jgi:hypothetical protein
LTPNDSIILESHEKRLQGVEDDVRAISDKVLPTLARLEQLVESGFERFTERFDDFHRRILNIETDHMMSQKRDIAAIADVETLKKVEKDRSHRHFAVISWVAGIAAAVVAGAVLAHFGLRP